MRNFRLLVEYDGTDYNGWQIQSPHQRRKGGRVKTVQGVLENALSALFSKKITLISSSRTDSGVHAKGHAANFQVRTGLNPQRVKKALNSLLPDDIVIRKVEEARPHFNAQYDAVSKLYRYSVYAGDYPPVFLRRYVYHIRQPLDPPLMRKEAAALLGRHDFSAFKSNDGRRDVSCRRNIKRLDIKKKNRTVLIEIEADGFLHNMVRNIVGTLIEVGRGKFPPGSVKKILKSRKRSAAGPAAPAKGLCLVGVKYPLV